jgi:hypothetical protein
MPLLSREVAESFKRPAATGSGNYLNPRDINETSGKVRVTFLGDDSATGYTVWGTSSKDPSKRVKLTFANEPTRDEVITRADEQDVVVKPDERITKFMGFFVWNYNDEAVQYFEFSQRGLIDPIIEALSDEEIEAEPSLYDFVLSATGSGLDKKYSVIPMPGKRRQEKTDKQIDAAFTKVLDDGADISVAASGGDVFKGTGF